MDKIFLGEQLKKITEKRKEMCEKLYQANLSIDVAKDQQINKKQGLIRDGLIIGKNEAEREACSAALMAEEDALVKKFNRELALLICEATKTNYDWDWISQQIKIEALV